MRTSKHGKSNTSCVRRSYALSWKPCQGDSLNLPDHRKHKDGEGDESLYHAEDRIQYHMLMAENNKDQQKSIKIQDHESSRV
ncbi:hypothetical protein Tco_0260347 [Tanacetum coccineum]